MIMQIIDELGKMKGPSIKKQPNIRGMMAKRGLEMLLEVLAPSLIYPTQWQFSYWQTNSVLQQQLDALIRVQVQSAQVLWTLFPCLCHTCESSKDKISKFVFVLILFYIYDCGVFQLVLSLSSFCAPPTLISLFLRNVFCTAASASFLRRHISFSFLRKNQQVNHVCTPQFAYPIVLS